MKIAYSPFDDEATVKAIYKNIKLFHRGLFSSFLEQYDLNIRVHNRSKQPLRDVSPDQQLYVFGHGSPGGNKISPMKGASLSLSDLAEQLFLDGMSLAQKKLKLFSCNGGVGGDNSMAAKLKTHLKKWGYNDIIVYGYTENMKIGTTGHLQQKFGKSGARAKDIRVQF